MNEFTHVDSNNQPGMVDVSDKTITKREATAESIVTLGTEILQQLTDGDIQSKKGPIFQTAIIAGTMAAKRTHETIPFCHPLPLEKCKFSITPLNTTQVQIHCTCSTSARTGVEMEALNGASAAALTIYDMCKAVSKAITINNTRLLTKSGGKSDFQAT
ncbi:cyclic pyranopterin monophosphate synthase MoaC [Rubritalea tangerina]|uniref:cyclic pyranopterin monophosphate synthase n=1 Tax=Rubritalea tangerina TaxID=430798 RepID=A0ABW4Z7Q0_9BACT